MNRKTSSGSGRQASSPPPTPPSADAAAMVPAPAAERILQFAREVQAAQLAIFETYATALKGGFEASTRASDLPSLLTAQGAALGTALAEALRRQGELLASWSALQSDLAREWSFPQPAFRPVASAGPSTSEPEPLDPKATMDAIQKALEDASNQWARWWKAALPAASTTSERST